MTKQNATLGSSAAKAGSLTKQRVFIDGEAGTTGLGIAQRLRGDARITLVSIDTDKRKDLDAKRELLSTVDLVVLCLPDDAARDTVQLADTLPGGGPRILDASTAHRTADGWIYGFAELARGQDRAIADGRRVANPGCYPTGAIALLRPLIDAGLLPADYPITVNAVSGYSGGGKSMIEAYDSGAAPAFELYGLGLEHKHLPELQHYSTLERRPLFVPSVGNFRQGMLVSIPLHLDTLPASPKVLDLENALAERYRGLDLVRLVPASERGGKLEAEAPDTDQMELFVFGNETRRQAVLVARLDNLGKGASGAAYQNIKLMLGLSG